MFDVVGCFYNCLLIEFGKNQKNIKRVEICWIEKTLCLCHFVPFAVRVTSPFKGKVPGPLGRMLIFQYQDWKAHPDF